MTVSELELAIDSNLADIARIGGPIRQVARQAGLDPMTCSQVELAVVEAVSNSIRHAYENRPGQSVEVRARLSSDRLEVRVFDRGLPPPPGLFDAERVRLPYGLTEGGRGAFLIATLMDEVRCQTDDSGNTLVLIKKLD